MAVPAPGRTSRSGRALPGRVGRAALLALITAASLLTASPASAEEVFTSQAAAANATDSTWIPAPPRRASVCIIDTGTDKTPDTTNVIARFATDDSDGSDISPVKHGTLMATIASAPKNDFGMVGAAPSVDVVSVRASRDGHTFNGLDVHAAIQLCVIKRNIYNIKVVSLSLGGDGGTVIASTAQRTEFQDAIDNARQYGLNVVAAAGNSERGVVDWPAGYGPAFAVGAATGEGGRCGFASWGSGVDLWAPGCPLDIGRPDASGSPAWANGSSEATAFVAGVLAQLRGLDPALDVVASERALIDGARSVAAGAFVDVGTAFRSAGLAEALAIGHSRSPANMSLAPSGHDIEEGAPTAEQTQANVVVAEVGPMRSSVATNIAPPASAVARPLARLSRPTVRFVTARHGLLRVSLKRMPEGVEARIEIYSRRQGKPFPSIAKRARFRTDALRIRFSGSISQLSIGYRDPTGVRERSEVIVVHPRT